VATKDLDFGNVLKLAYDPPTESLKVLATISIGSISVDLDAATDSVRLGDGTLLSTFTSIGPKNALDVNIAGGALALDISHTDDSIRLGDGTNLVTVTTIGLKQSLDVNIANTSFPLSVGAATEAKQEDQITLLTSIDDKLTLPLEIAAVSLPLPLGAATESKQDEQIQELINVNLELENINTSLTAVSTSANQVIANNSLASIDNKLTSPLSVVATGTVSVEEPLQISGTNNGLSSGIEYGYVYNQKQQVLASDDREETYTYADFGTKDQRIVRIDYTSNTFPGIIVRRDFNYVLENNKYKRTDSFWSVI
jgi:hypothetical protein